MNSKLIRQGLKLRSGVSLLELMLTLVVIEAIVFVAVRYYTHVRENSKVTQAATQINLVANVSYKWMSMQNQDNFCGGAGGACTNPISVQKLISAGLLNDADTRTPWLSTINVSYFPANPAYVNIELNKLPQTACENLKLKLKGKVKEINNNPQMGCTFISDQDKWEFWGVF